MNMTTLTTGYAADQAAILCNDQGLELRPLFRPETFVRTADGDLVHYEWNGSCWEYTEERGIFGKAHI